MLLSLRHSRCKRRSPTLYLRHRCAPFAKEGTKPNGWVFTLSFTNLGPLHHERKDDRFRCVRFVQLRGWLLFHAMCLWRREHTTTRVHSCSHCENEVFWLLYALRSPRIQLVHLSWMTCRYERRRCLLLSEAIPRGNQVGFLSASLSGIFCYSSRRIRMTVKEGGMWSTMCSSAIPFSILPAMMRVRRGHVLRHFTLSSLKADSTSNRQIRFPPLHRNPFVTLWMTNCLNCAPSVLISNWRRIMHIPVCCIVE